MFVINCFLDCSNWIYNYIKKSSVGFIKSKNLFIFYFSGIAKFYEKLNLTVFGKLAIIDIVFLNTVYSLYCSINILALKLL